MKFLCTHRTGCMVILLLASVILPAMAWAQNTVIDTYFCIDVSRSMVNNNVFEEVRKRVLEDVATRQTGDFVSITQFGTGFKEIATRTMQARADNGYLKGIIEKLTPDQQNTFLYKTYLATIEAAWSRAKNNPNHFVEIRLYTDGKNTGTGPRPNLDDVIAMCEQAHQDVNNLQITHIQYTHPDEDAKTVAIIEEMKQRLAGCGIGLGFITDKFVRIVPHRLDFGNLRGSDFRKGFNIVSFNIQDITEEERKFELQPELHSKHGLVLNTFPRPALLSDRAIGQTFEIVNPESLPALSAKPFEGKLRIMSKAANIKFVPQSIGFSFENKTIRPVALLIEDAAGAGRCENELWVSLRNASFFTDDELFPVFTRLSVVDSSALLAGDKVDITIRIPDTVMKGYEFAAFVQSEDLKESGLKTVSVDKNSRELLLRTWYRWKVLKHLKNPGHYPVDLVITPSSPEVVPVVGYRPDQELKTRATSLIRIFPGPLPDCGQYRADDDQVAINPGIKIPPPAWKRWISAILAGIAIALLLRLCKLPWISCVLLALAYIVPAGLWGKWHWLFVVPHKYYIPEIWCAVAGLHILLPFPFAWLWFTGGWVIYLEDGSYLSLREISLNNGQNGFQNHCNRNILNQEDIEGGVFMNNFQLAANGLFPPRLYLRAFGNEIQIPSSDGMYRPVAAGTTERLQTGSSFTEGRQTYRVRFKLIGK